MLLKMTFEEKLYRILSWLVSDTVQKTPADKYNSFYQIEIFSKILEEKLDIQEVELIKSKLIEDEYIRFSDNGLPVFQISNSAIVFVNNGGYLKEKEKNSQENLERKRWAKMKRREFAIVIIMALVAILSFIFGNFIMK